MLSLRFILFLSSNQAAAVCICNIPSTRLTISRGFVLVLWSCLGDWEPPERADTKESQGLVGDCTWNKPVKCLFPNVTGQWAWKGQCGLVCRCPCSGQLGVLRSLGFWVDMEIFITSRKNESLDVGSRVDPLKSHDGGLVCSASVYGWVHIYLHYENPKRLGLSLCYI